MGVGRSWGGTLPAFLTLVVFFFFSSFPNDDPALSSVVDLWGFYWGVWRLSGSLGVGNGNWLGLKEESRGSNWLCAEGSVCRRGYCGASVTALHWGRPPLWGPEEILANVEDCHLEGCLNCFLWRLGYLWREEKKKQDTGKSEQKQKAEHEGGQFNLTQSNSEKTWLVCTKNAFYIIIYKYPAHKT